VIQIEENDNNGTIYSCPGCDRPHTASQLHRSTDLKISHWFYWPVSLFYHYFIFCQNIS